MVRSVSDWSARSRSRAGRFLAAAAGWVLAVVPVAGTGRPRHRPFEVAAAGGRRIDFEVDVRPVLADACYSCHGRAKQKGGFRLDVKNRGPQGR